MKLEYKMNISKSYSYKDDVNHQVSYHIEPTRIPDIISGWEDSGYVVHNVQCSGERVK